MHAKARRLPLLQICFLCGTLVTGASPAAGGTITYSYDAAGRLVSAVYPDGATITYTYDAAGNLLRREVEGGTQQVSRGPGKAIEPAPLAELEGETGEELAGTGAGSLSCSLTLPWGPPEEPDLLAEIGG